MNSLSALAGKTVAVTGASGYIGVALIDRLLKCSCKIISVSRRNSTTVPNCELLIGDIREEAIWDQIVKKADIIIHLAGNTSLNFAEINPADSLYSTLNPFHHMLKFAKTSGRRPRVVFASTASIYGLTTCLPVDENFPLKPISTYDLHKLYAERQIEMASEQGVIEGVSLRLSNVYGPSAGISSSSDRGILNKLTAMAFQRTDLTLYGGGKNIRDYVYIDDVVSAFLLAGVSDQVIGKSFNVGSGVGVSLREAFHLVAAEVSKLSGARINVCSTSWPENTPLIEKRDFVANINFFKNTTGWVPSTSFNRGVALMASAYQKFLF